MWLLSRLPRTGRSASRVFTRQAGAGRWSTGAGLGQGEQVAWAAERDAVTGTVFLQTGRGTLELSKQDAECLRAVL
ncbi:hypothetical protein [Actinoplanes flavus]|uniref:Uncharacterized protein n=1 Tax=Actinoplanes flavus TaxID=2820290 RepID=A0ABS3UIC5_9ACTN|nr:hypothetical protein [Actinoplanes flavus]MBO3738533.1 hypothetical protein [Actinoplanes flavus]